MNIVHLRPKKRSKYRILLGTWFYTMKQCMEWIKEHAITPAYWGGYVRSNAIYRRVYNRQNELIDDQYVTENQAIMMYEPLLEYKSQV